MLRSPLINVMVNAALKAGKGLKRDFGELEHLQVSTKGPGDFVSIADKRSEKILYQELEKARPGYGFLMEESGNVDGRDKTHRWIVDPLDGTVNFLHGIPFFCISLGLEREGALVAGVVYNPANDDIFVAERGSGAYCNDRRIRVSKRSAMADTLLSAGFSSKRADDRIRNERQIAALETLPAGMRRLGATALEMSYVAAGRLDGLWHQGVHPWDIAAGIVLVREAGGFVTDVDGNEPNVSSGTIIAGNEDVHKSLLKTRASTS